MRRFGLACKPSLHHVPHELDNFILACLSSHKEQYLITSKSQFVADEDDFKNIIIEDATTTPNAADIYNIRYSVSYEYSRGLLKLVLFAGRGQLKLDGNSSSPFNKEGAKLK